MDVSTKQSTPNFPKNEHFLPHDKHTYVRKKCFLETFVLRFDLLPYYQRYLMWIYFLEVKNIAFRQDLFSQIDLFEMFHLDYFSRTNQLRTIEKLLFPNAYVVVNIDLSIISELLLIFCNVFLSQKELKAFKLFNKSSVVLLVQGQHVHQSVSIGNLLAKSSMSIFLTC